MKIKRLKLKGLFNTRDLGGLPAADGKKIAAGKLIRSGKLYKIPEETVKKLKDLGVTTVVDIRVPAERENAPDVIWEGVNYVCAPLVTTATPGITHESSMRKVMAEESKRIKREFGSTDNYMCEVYRMIVMSEELQPNLQRVMRLIIDNEGCILWHCSGGKDRAGIIAMLVEKLLGVSDDVILADYIASLRFQRKRHFWHRAGLVIAPCSLRLKKILYGMMAAKPAYLMGAVRAIEEKYGSVENYCKVALNISDEDIQTLRDKYLV